MTKTFISSSSAETKKFAERLARRLVRAKSPRRHALVVALSGDLGSGKTTFVQGFFRGLGIKKRVTSPTFIIMRRSNIPHQTPRFRNAYHVDAYRVRKSKELSQLGFKEILKNPENIVLIEWAERVRPLLHRRAQFVVLSHEKKENVRHISL